MSINNNIQDETIDIIIRNEINLINSKEEENNENNKTNECEIEIESDEEENINLKNIYLYIISKLELEINPCFNLYIDIIDNISVECNLTFDKYRTLMYFTIKEEEIHKNSNNSYDLYKYIFEININQELMLKYIKLLYKKIIPNLRFNKLNDEFYTIYNEKYIKKMEYQKSSYILTKNLTNLRHTLDDCIVCYDLTIRKLTCCNKQLCLECEQKIKTCPNCRKHF
jgi:hypothetical protein